MSKNSLLILPHILAFFTSFIGPLIVLLVSSKKDMRNHAKKALNWQLSIMIYFIISIVLMIILIGFFLLFILSLLNLIFIIIATIKASEQKLWDYPLAIKFFK